MIQLIRNKDFYGVGLTLLIVFLIGYQELISPAIGIFILLIAAEFFIAKSLRFTFCRSNFLFVLFYLLYILGMTWSEHPDIGWKLMEYKMSFFVFPALFLFKKENLNYWLVLQGAVIGCLVLAARILFIKYTSSLDLPEYEIANGVLQIHPSYACIYFTTGIFILLYGKYLDRFNISWWLVVTLSLIFVFMILQLGSFAGILFLGLTALCILGWWLYKRVKIWGVLLVMILGPVFFVFTVLKMDRFAYDIEMVKAVYNEIGQGKAYYFEKNREDNSGTKIRVLLWLISAEIIVENPMGVGTGDIDFELLDKTKEHDLVVLQQKVLNPHNQFFQTGVDIGIPGILVLLLIIGVNFVRGLRHKNYLLSFLAFSMAFNALFESVLQKQAGIVFYSLLICLVAAFLVNDSRALMKETK